MTGAPKLGALGTAAEKTVQHEVGILGSNLKTPFPDAHNDQLNCSRLSTREARCDLKRRMHFFPQGGSGHCPPGSCG